MASDNRSTSYKYIHDNYSTVAAASVATKNASNTPMDYLLISNTDAANDAKISFDAGVTFITLKHGFSLELYPAKMVSYKVKDAVDNSHATLECLYGSEI